MTFVAIILFLGVLGLLWVLLEAFFDGLFAPESNRSAPRRQESKAPAVRNERSDRSHAA